MFCGCQGDSGGPFVCPNDGMQWELYGAVSWGEPCAVAMRPTVYARVAAYRAWIAKKIREDSN